MTEPDIVGVTGFDTPQDARAKTSNPASSAANRNRLGAADGNLANSWLSNSVRPGDRECPAFGRKPFLWQNPSKSTTP